MERARKSGGESGEKERERLRVSTRGYLRGLVAKCHTPPPSPKANIPAVHHLLWVRDSISAEP